MLNEKDKNFAAKLTAQAERIKLLEQQLTAALTLQKRNKENSPEGKADMMMGVEKQVDSSPVLQEMQSNTNKKRSKSATMVPGLDLSRVLPNFSKKQQEDQMAHYKKIQANKKVTHLASNGLEYCDDGQLATETHPELLMSMSNSVISTDR